MKIKNDRAGVIYCAIGMKSLVHLWSCKPMIAAMVIKFIMP